MVVLTHILLIAEGLHSFLCGGWYIRDVVTVQWREEQN